MYRKPNAPLSVGGVIQEAIRLYRESFRRCLPIAVLGAAISAAFDLLILGYARHAGMTLSGPEQILEVYEQPPIMALSLLYGVLSLAVLGALLVMQNAVANRDTLLRAVQAINIGFARLGRCVIAFVVSTVLIVLGCFLVLPGLYLSGALALWPVALYVENAHGLQSLDVSRKLIYGYWWHASSVLGVALLGALAFSMVAGFIAAVIGTVLGTDAAGLGLGELISAVAVVFMLPMVPVSLIALYNDLQQRRSGVDAERRAGGAS
jgi:hypothetical protein